MKLSLRKAETDQHYMSAMTKNEATVGTRVYNTNNGTVPTIIQVASEASIAQPGEDVKFLLCELVERMNNMFTVHNPTKWKRKKAMGTANRNIRCASKIRIRSIFSTIRIP